MSLCFKIMWRRIWRTLAIVQPLDVKLYLNIREIYRNSGVHLAANVTVCTADRRFIKAWLANQTRRLWLVWTKSIRNSCIWQRRLNSNSVLPVSSGWRRMMDVIIWPVDASTSFAIYVGESTEIAIVTSRKRRRMKSSLRWYSHLRWWYSSQILFGHIQMRKCNYLHCFSECRNSIKRQ